MSGAFCVECGQQGAGHAGAARMQATVVNPRSGFRMTGKIWIKVVYIGVVILAFTFVTTGSQICFQTESAAAGTVDA